MAFIDFSLDSRIRKKYVPLTTQQRFMRHVKRVAARNLCIPSALLQPLVDVSLDVTSKNVNLDDQDQIDTAVATTALDDIEESQALILNLNIAFYFTIIHPPLANCLHCQQNDQQSCSNNESPPPPSSSSPSTTNIKTATASTTNYQQCNCNRVLYRSELVASANPSWKPFEGSTLCSPSISYFTIRLYFVKLDAAATSEREQQQHEERTAKVTIGANNYTNKCVVINSTDERTSEEEETSRLSDAVAAFRVNNVQATTTTATQKTISIMMRGDQGPEKFHSKDEEEAGTLFLQWQVHLCGLICIGEEIPKDRRLAKNALIFGLHEGFYSAFSSVTSEDLLRHIVPPTELLQVRPALARRSYCMNTLTRIQMMQYIIQATAVEAKRVRTRLEEAIERTRTKREAVMRFERLRSSTAFLRELLDQRRGQLRAAQGHLASLENEIFEVESETSSRVQLLKEQLHLLMAYRSERLLETRRKLELTVSALVQRRRALAKVLFQDVYRIVPFPDARGFSICGVFLPDSEAVDQHDAKMVSVALGYVTHLVALLSLLLDVHLNYQLVTFGSRSLIVDPNNAVLRENEKLLPLHSRSGRNVIFFKYGLYLLNRTIVGIRRSVGLKTVSVARTLANLYSLFTECLLMDNYNVAADMTLNRISPYSPSFDLLDPELVALSTGEAWNQHFLNDINFIKDNDYMNDCLWKEVEALTISVALNRSMPLSASYSTSSSHRYQLTLRTPSMTPSLDGGSFSGSAVSGGSTQHQQTLNNSPPYLEEFRQSIARQRLYRRTASSQRLSQITACLSSSYGVTSSSAASSPPSAAATSPLTSQQQLSRPQPPAVVSTVSSPENIIRQPRNRRGSSTNVLLGTSFNNISPSSPSSLSSLMGLGSFLHHSNGGQHHLNSSAAAQQRLQQLQQRSIPRAAFSHQQHRRIRSISGYGATHSLGVATSSSYSGASTGTARSSFLHPLESSLNSQEEGGGGHSSSKYSPTLSTGTGDDPRRRKLSQPISASHPSAAMLSCSLDKGLNRLMQLASSSSSLNSSLSTNASESRISSALTTGDAGGSSDATQHLLPSSYLNVEAGFGNGDLSGRVIEDPGGLFNGASSFPQLETTTESGGGDDNVKIIEATEQLQKQRSWLHAAAESLEAATAAATAVVTKSDHFIS